jgi:hypothetical protein
MEANLRRMVSLNGSNYHIWKGKMEDLLYVKQFHLPVFASEKLENKYDEEWTLLHRQVMCVKCCTFRSLNLLLLIF